MKAWRHWLWFLALWAAPALSAPVSVSVSPEGGSCQDESGRISATADAATMAASMRVALGKRVTLRPSLEGEIASQTFVREAPASRELAILDQRGIGLGLGLDLLVGNSKFWRMETSFALGENQARVAATYASRQELTSYSAPYGRWLAATGAHLPLTGPFSFTLLGGWRETRLQAPRGLAEVTGTAAKPSGGLTLTHSRVALDDQTALRAPTALSGWFIRVGLEAQL